MSLAKSVSSSEPSLRGRTQDDKDNRPRRLAWIAADMAMLVVICDPAVCEESSARLWMECSHFNLKFNICVSVSLRMRMCV